MNPLTPEALVVTPRRLLARIPLALVLCALAGCPEKHQPTPAGAFPNDTATVLHDSDTGDTAVPHGGCRATYGALGFPQPITYAATSIALDDPTSPCAFTNLNTGPQLLMTLDDQLPFGLDVRVKSGPIVLGVADVNEVTYCQSDLADPRTTFMLAEIRQGSDPWMTVRLGAKTITTDGVLRWDGEAWCDTQANLGDPADPFHMPASGQVPFARYTFEVIP